VGTTPARKLLGRIPGARVEEVDAGCCGMAGAFGYEAEHFGLSQEIGELVLFPAIREATPDTLIVATGTSCRQQIRFATGRVPLHPVQVFMA
jgi:Fe-S oxidoreductase